MAIEDAATLTPAAVARYQRLCAAFDRVQPLAADAREALLLQLARNEPDLLDELHAMLAASDGPGLQPLACVADTALPAGLGDERGYRVLRELGRGGMGRVLLAERADGRFARQVAIKVLDHSPDDPDWRRRFAAEREILARLVHPQIVRLLDAGETAAGVPYLVMEYVDGEPLDRYLRDQRPGLDARLDLFDGIAGAVSHAHQNLVAHRDIKPANVLVDRNAAPHLLDFGIARLLSTSLATATAARAMTPRYAAPEQVSGAPGTAALDIYQLGLLLYEMLAGVPPFADLDGPALLRAVLEVDPLPPGRFARSMPWADARRVDSDLDAICLCALRKEPNQRYPSVDAMVDDLQRWRAGEPVRARSGGWWYRTRKFGRRHWLLIASTAAVVALSVIFVVQLNRELARTESERAIAEQATDLMVDVIGRADPSRAQGKELTLREALDQSVERLRQAPDVPDRVRARLLEAVGNTYLELSRGEPAIALMAEAADAYARTDDWSSQERVLQARAIALQTTGRYADAQAALESLLALRRQRGHQGDALDAELHGSLGNLHQFQRRGQQALAEYDRALIILRHMANPDQEQLAHALRNLGDIQTAQGDAPAGMKSLAEAQTLIQKLYGPDHPETIRMYRGLGRNAQRRGQYDEALAYFQDGWERAQRVFTPPHAVRVLLAHPLALALFHRGDYVQAQTLMTQALAEGEQLFAADHPSRATLAVDLSFILLQQGSPAQARAQAEFGRASRVAAQETDAHIAEPELVLAILDCQQHPSTAALAQVQQTLARVESDPALAQALAEDYRRSAALCTEK